MTPGTFWRSAFLPNTSSLFWCLIFSLHHRAKWMPNGLRIDWNEAGVEHVRLVLGVCVCVRAPLCHRPRRSTAGTERERHMSTCLAGRNKHSCLACVCACVLSPDKNARLCFGFFQTGERRGDGEKKCCCRTTACLTYPNQDPPSFPPPTPRNTATCVENGGRTTTVACYIFNFFCFSGKARS